MIARDKDDSPLRKWLDRNNFTIRDFAQAAKISTRTLYELLAGDKHRYMVDTLLKIEEATSGEVSMRDMTDWLAARWETA